jgi:hypothetical protein
MKKKLPKIYFVFPYKGVGGVSLLFLRVAEYLHATGRADCALIDYEDGFMARHLKDSGVKLIAYSARKASTVIAGDGTIVFQSMTPWSIFPGLVVSPEASVLFWNCHPFNLIPVLPGFRKKMQQNLKLSQAVYSFLLRRYVSKMRIFIDLLMRRSALVFMDAPNVKITERFLDLKLNNPRYLPVAMDSHPRVAGLHHQNTPEEGKQIRITWLGRIVDFKFFPLLNFLQQLDATLPASKNTIIVNIIGSGDYHNDLKRRIRGLKNLEVNFLQSVSPSDLPSFICDHTDLMIGMGTSLLEGARLGIPSVLLDASYGPVSKSYKFKFLYESSDYSLADFLNKGDAGSGGRTIANILTSIINDFSSESAKTLEYFHRNHEIEATASKLLEYVAETKLRFGELNASHLLEKPLAYKLLLAIRG